MESSFLSNLKDLSSKTEGLLIFLEFTKAKA